jgi:hypothetical protein
LGARLDPGTALLLAALLAPTDAARCHDDDQRLTVACDAFRVRRGGLWVEA